MNSLKKSFAAFLLLLPLVSHSVEMSEKNINTLSKLNDVDLMNSIVLIDYKLSALERRNEALEGIAPIEYNANSLKLMQQAYVDAQDSRKLYSAALERLSSEDQLEEINKLCRKSYNFKKIIPEILKESFAKVIRFRKNPTANKVLGAQEWTKLQLLKNYYLSSLTSYQTGEVYSGLMGVSAQCFNDDQLYQELYTNDAKMLATIDRILNEVVGQPGLRSSESYSQIMSKKIVEESSLGNQARSIGLDIAIESAYYFAGYGAIKYAFKGIQWAPKVYKYGYGIVTGASAMMSRPEALDKIDTENIVKNNLSLFEKRLRIFIHDPDNLEKQRDFAIEMEEVVFQERLDLALEANRLCKGKCEEEKVVELKEKLKRNIKEIQYVLEKRN